MTDDCERLAFQIVEESRISGYLNHGYDEQQDLGHLFNWDHVGVGVLVRLMTAFLRRHGVIVPRSPYLTASSRSNRRLYSRLERDLA